MVPPAYNRLYTCYPSTVTHSLLGSERVRGETSKGRGELKPDRVEQRRIVSQRQRRTCTGFWGTFKDLFHHPSTGGKKLDMLLFPFVPSERWKAPAHSPCQVVRRVHVRNTPPRNRSPRGTGSSDLWRNSRGRNNLQRSANWPGRPDRPPPYPRRAEQHTVQIPPALDLRLHPYLQHRCNGTHPILFDIALGPNRITYSGHTSSTAAFDLANLAQPATYPPVTYMHIESVADDPLPHFPWLIVVQNPRGITCGDVLHAISRSFRQYVSEDEYNGWSRLRKKMAARAYYARVCGTLDPAKPRRGDGLRRIDYIGERVIFRGLEQASALLRGTWLMYFGSERRRASCFGAANVA